MRYDSRTGRCDPTTPPPVVRRCSVELPSPYAAPVARLSVSPERTAGNDRPVADDPLAVRVAAIADARGDRRIGTAESCTAGMVATALASGEQASDWFRGGVVSYHRDVKYDLLEVPRGPVVNHETARAMVEGAARALGADAVVSVTGAAGPDGLDGAPPGTVFVGFLVDGKVDSVEHHFAGEPAQVCASAALAALDGLADRLREARRRSEPAGEAS
jgi:nicotinamide-nucleotide amidase